MSKMPSKTSVMIFGAGFGTRMQPLSLSRPKPLIEIAGKPLLDHALDLADTRPAVVNTHYLADQMDDHLADRSTVTISHEHPDILDTGGGLKHALPLLGDGPVLTLNPDAVWAGPNPLDLLEAAWQPDDMGALLMLVPKRQTVGFTRGGDFHLADSGRLRRDAKGLIYTGTQILHTDSLAQFTEPSFSLVALWEALIARNRLFGMVYPGQWADVGTPEGIPLAEDMLIGHAMKSSV